MVTAQQAGELLVTNNAYPRLKSLTNLAGFPIGFEGDQDSIADVEQLAPIFEKLGIGVAELIGLRELRQVHALCAALYLRADIATPLPR